MSELLENLLQVEINITEETRDMNQSDIERLLKLHSLIEEARNAFIAGELTFEEYIELLEMSEINVDSYLGNLENNLTIVGAL